MTADAGRQEIWRIVRMHDPDRYLSALFVPPPVRNALMALYAFHCETARIPLIVSEPMLGEIRLQWWRDALDAPDKATGNPLADALNLVIAQYSLPRALVTGAVDARGFDLDDRPMPDMQALGVYLGKTEGAVFALAAQILAGRHMKADWAARQAGLALGLTRLLLDLPRDHTRGRRFLPADVTPEPGGGTGALAHVHDLARQALAEARLALRESSKSVLPAFLPLALVEPGLRASERRADPVHEAARINPLARHWRLWRAVLRGRV